MFVLYWAVLAYVLKFTCVKNINVKINISVLQDVQGTD